MSFDAFGFGLHDGMTMTFDSGMSGLANPFGQPSRGSFDGPFVVQDPNGPWQFPSFAADGGGSGTPPARDRGTDNSNVCFAADLMTNAAGAVGVVAATPAGQSVIAAAPVSSGTVFVGVAVTYGVGLVTGYVGGCYGNGGTNGG
jgi:hypothetical protein